MHNDTQTLIDRMLNFSAGSVFDGYPGITCYDVSLIHSVSGIEFEDGMLVSCPIVFLSYLASENAKTREQYDNCKRYISAYVADAWETNMCEGDNPVHAELNQ